MSRVQITKLCLECGHKFIARDNRQQYCNHSCSAIHSNKHRIFKPSKDKRTKIIKCSICSRKIEVNIRTPNTVKCDECKKKKCKYCGQEKCLRTDVCKNYQIFPTLIKYFGFDEFKIGTINIYKEFDRIRNKLIEEYWDKEMSSLDLAKKYNHYHVGNFNKILDAINIEKRTFSKANHLAFIKGKNSPPINPKYKHGWHTTWDNKKVFYRSSYELKYAKELDKQKTEYEMESLRILYWDSQRQIQRVAIPDFYLPKKNKIVEIKSPWTLDEQNMKDKEKAYKEHGYKFELIIKNTGM